MFLINLKLQNFRNYENVELSFNKNINIFYGENAQGKTNLLEAIYFLALTKSYRTSNNESVIREGQEFLNIYGILNDIQQTKLFIGLKNNKKRLKLNDSIIKKHSDYISIMNVINFCPENLNIIKENPEIRRDFINTEVGQLSSNYISVLNDYNKLLKMRNDYLKIYSDKEIFDEKYFCTLTEYLIDKGLLIYKARKKFIDKLNIYVPKIFKKLCNKENFSIEYLPNYEVDELDYEKTKKNLKLKYNKLLDKEKYLKKTLFGIHKDDIRFLIGNYDLREYGSQGQQRMAIIVTKLAEMEIFNSIKHSYPILLLDDVFSELDATKKNSLLEYIENDNIQTVITCTDLNSIKKTILEKSKKIKIQDGEIVEESKNE